MVSFATAASIIFSLVVNLSYTEGASLKTRELTTCATLKACFLVNIETRDETRLSGNDSFTLDPANGKGYSIRCDVNSAVGRISKVKFSFDSMRNGESASPYYMLGDEASGTIINRVKYLSKCGSKLVKIEGSLNDKLCFEKSFTIDVKSPSGASCDTGSPTTPVAGPVRTPAAVPMRAPVMTPVMAPVRAPSSGSCPAQVTGYTLIDATLDSDIIPLGNYNMGDVPELLNIRVDIFPCREKVVESVLIDFDGMIRCESFAPYNAFGDQSTVDRANDNTNYDGKAISSGRHTIKATPYSGDKCRGTAGRTHTLVFTVEDDEGDDEY